MDSIFLCLLQSFLSYSIVSILYTGDLSMKFNYKDNKFWHFSQLKWLALDKNMDIIMHPVVMRYYFYKRRRIYIFKMVLFMKHLSTSLNCTIYKVCYRIFPCVLLTALHRRLVEIKYKKFATRRIMWTYGLNLLYAIAITATFILFGDSGNATIDTITVNCYKIYSCLVFRQCK